MPKNRFPWLPEWLRSILVVVLVLSIIRSAAADWNDVPTGSMKPTIMEGDRIFVNKLAYGLRLPFSRTWLAQWGGPQRGEVVVCFWPGSDIRMVKRVVGLPGDEIELRNNRLMLNGREVIYDRLDGTSLDDYVPRPLDVFATENLGGHPHAILIQPDRPARRSFGPMRVPPNEYFLMGDNRDNSRDSRWDGFITRDRIVGRATRIVLSLDPDRYYLPRWDRFFHALP